MYERVLFSAKCGTRNCISELIVAANLEGRRSVAGHRARLVQAGSSRRLEGDGCSGCFCIRTYVVMPLVKDEVPESCTGR